MPLRKGKSQAILSANIRQLVHEGYPVKQAAAIAYKTAGLSNRKDRKMAKRKRKSAASPTATRWRRR